MTPRKESQDGSEAVPTGFSGLGLDERVVQALTTLGYEEPTPVQREAIPPLLAGRDVLGQAATGTGKTAAFALPLLHILTPDADPRERTRAFILVPTRELAMQVAEAVHKYGRAMGIIAMPIYGGASMETQIRALKRGVDVVVATPGRALDHIRRKTLRLEGVRTVILDEADEMLDMGFAEDLEAILDAMPAERQTALFSATLPPRIAEIANKHLKDPVRVRIDREVTAVGSAPRVRQVAYIVNRAHKMATLGRILDVENPTSAIVFCRTRIEVDQVTETLNARGFRAEALHGGLSQDQRDRVMKKFRANTADLLVATDVAARGLDVEHVSHVVNYDLPTAAEAYIHRIGRTGRAGREGVAITLAEPREHRQLRNIEYLTKQKIEIAAVPTVADLRARRLEMTRASLRETILGGELDQFRVLVDSLAQEFDIMDVAAAAIKQADAKDNVSDAEEIPAVTVRPDRPASRHDRERAPTAKAGSRRHDAAKAGAAKAAGREKITPEWDVARLYIGAGRTAKIRPADLVGAIVNEAGVDPRAIGAIQITERFSLVEVPDEIADSIIETLRAATIKGKRVPVRRDREQGGAG
ncbi:MAG: heavy metal transporter [Gemmatimonadetes bacterium]|jgi:ATP-dependent RNA helicase DeaD|nr:heavy metal transporter [Gemmatimonadota bacterium]